MSDRHAPASASRPGSRPETSLVSLVAAGALDAELGALAWLLVEAGVPLVVAVPAQRMAAGAQLLGGVLGSVLADPADAARSVAPLDRLGAWRVVHGERPGAVVGAASLEELRNELSRSPFHLSRQELTFLGCVMVLAAPPDRPGGRLRVSAGHYVRPLARDAHGHPQELPPAVLATWDPRLGRYEHFAWGVLPEIAARLNRKTGDLEADLHHRRDDLGGLAKAGVAGLDEVRRLIAGYRVGYGGPHEPGGSATRPH